MFLSRIKLNYLARFPKFFLPVIKKPFIQKFLAGVTLTTSLFGYQYYYSSFQKMKCTNDTFKFNTTAQFTLTIYHYKSDIPMASGIIIDENGLCISIASIFPNISEDRVDLDNFYAKILGQDTHYKLTLQAYIPDQNLVLFKLIRQDPDIKFNPAKFSLNPDIGTDAYVIGKSPHQYTILERGIINELNYNVKLGFGKERDTTSFNIMASIPNIHPSIYGGPLVDKSGVAFGMLIPFDNTLLPDHLLVMPYDYLSGIIEQCKSTGKVRRPYLGMTIKSAASGNGAYVIKVNSDGPASQAGVKLGDTVLEVNEHKITNSSDFFKCLGFKLGEKLKLKVEKDGKPRVIFINPE